MLASVIHQEVMKPLQQKAHWNPREHKGQKEKWQRSEKPVLPVSSKALAAAEQTGWKRLRTDQHLLLQKLRRERGLQSL